ncbi:porin [Pseudovibrio sp. SCP19]|uniref:porin n=1 Tax=Pseudovibrio sp. SCP19 TaxID=3141374 RepID=UPI0033361007
MNVKTLALAAAAAAVATSSQAADLPVAAEPVDYVQACDAFGAGFFKLPGKDTCIKLGGRIRAQVVSGNLSAEKGDRDDDGNSNDGDEYDAYAKGYLYFTSMTNSEIGTIKTYTELTASWSDDTTNASIDAGDVYLQLGTGYGSFLFGRTASLFDSFTGYTYIGPVDTDLSDSSALQVQFTADLGNGVTASVAAQDSTYRGGEENAADLLGALQVSQGWGSFKLAGVLHDRAGHDDYGYGVGATAVFNLDMLKEGTEVTFQAQYADEAGEYIDVSEADATGYSLAAGFQTSLTDTVSTQLDMSYLALDNDIDSTRFAVNGSVAYAPVAGLVFAVAAGWEQADADDVKATDISKIGARVQYTF